MFVRALRADEEEIIKGVVALMARMTESKQWVWTEKDYNYARRVVDYSFIEDRISCVVIDETVGVVGWAAAYETTGKLWKTAVIVYDRKFKSDDVTAQEMLESGLHTLIESRGGISEKSLYQAARRTDLTDKLSHN